MKLTKRVSKILFIEVLIQFFCPMVAAMSIIDLRAFPLIVKSTLSLSLLATSRPFQRDGKSQAVLCPKFILMIIKTR